MLLTSHQSEHPLPQNPSSLSTLKFLCILHEAGTHDRTSCSNEQGEQHVRSSALQLVDSKIKNGDLGKMNFTHRISAKVGGSVLQQKNDVDESH